MNTYSFFTEPLTSLTMTSEYYSNECDCNGCNNFYPIISGTVLFTSIVTAIISTMTTAIIMSLFCDEKCRGKNRISTAYVSTHSHEQFIQNAVGPLYEEVELTNKDLPLNYSQNVAYQYNERNKEVSLV